MTTIEGSVAGTGFDRETRGRWVVSFIFVLGSHIAVFAFVLNWKVPHVAPEAPPSAVMIDMTPTPPASEQPKVEPEVSPAEKPDLQPDRLPVMEKPEVVLKKTPPKPKPVRPAPPKVKPRNAPSASSSAPAAPALAVSPVEASLAATPNYLSALFGHLERYKKYPRVLGGRHSDLTVLVHVELDRQGKLLSLGIVKSSGSETYDNAAMATFRRAEPMPPFPASMTRPMLSLNVPVRFKQEE